MTHQFQTRQLIRRPLDEVFAFFSEARNLEAITPTFLRFRIATPAPIRMRQGTRIDYRLWLYGVPVHWRTLISEWHPNRYFADEQEAGPFEFWRHVHEFERVAEGVRMTDTVSYAPPLGALGELARRLFVARTLGRIFEYRRQAIARLLESDGSGPETDRQPAEATP